MRLRPLVGVLWVLILVLPWFVAIMARAGDSFLQESVGQDLLAKVFQGQETHGAPPGYYLLLFWLTFWPAAPLAAIVAPSVWRERREPATRFLLAWIVPSWIVFELVITKLPHYVLPLYPAIAILIARAIERRMLSTNPHLTRFTVMWPIFAAVLPAVAIIGLIYMRGQFGWLGWPFAAGAAIFGFYAWRLYDIEGAERSFVRASIGALFMADRGVRRRAAADAAGVPEPRARRNDQRERMPQSGGCRGRLSRAESGVSRRHAHAPCRRRDRRRDPARRRLPARDHREPPGPRLRAARRAQRPALQPARPGREQHQHQWRAPDQLHDLPLGGANEPQRRQGARSRPDAALHRRQSRRLDRAARPAAPLQGEPVAAAVAAPRDSAALPASRWSRWRCSSSTRAA